MADDYDSPWKEAITTCFYDFVDFFFPRIAARIDWSKPFIFLEQERRSVTNEIEAQSSYVDKLVRVFTREGEPEWVLIHVEIQSQAEITFAQRMFLYHARLYERFRQPIASLAVFADNNKHWRPDHFNYERFGCRLSLQYPVCKLLDWVGSEAALADTKSPFALITRAHLATQSTRTDPVARENLKIQLLRDLYRSGMGRQQIIDLFRVIDWMMKLPKENDFRFRQTMQAIEEDAKMRYVTSIERLAKEEGLQQGMQQGLARMLARQINRRFGELPDWARAKLEQANEREIETWGESVLTAKTITAVFASPDRE